MSSMEKNSFEEAELEVVDREDTLEVVVEAEYGTSVPWNNEPAPFGFK